MFTYAQVLFIYFFMVVMFVVFHGYFSLWLLVMSWQVCWMCLATKGNSDDLVNAYTNTQRNWEHTFYQQAPFNVEPAVCKLTGWQLQMVHPDILHCFHLGVGRDLCGSAIKLLVQRGYFPGRKHSDRFEFATRSLKQFAKQNKYGLARRKLDKKGINWKTGEFAELKTKGYDTFIVCSWLARLLEEDDGGLTELATTIWCVDNALSLTANSNGIFLTAREYEQLDVMGRIFADHYLRLAHTAVLNGAKEFRTRPKFHAMQHILMANRPSRINMHHYSTWMDEDANRKFMRVNRVTHRRTAAKRVLERWLLGLPSTFKKLDK